MKPKITARATPKGGKVRTLTLGNQRVDIYTATRTVRKGAKVFRYEVFQVADFSQNRRRLRMFYNLRDAIADAERIARKMQSGEVMAAQMNSREAAAFGRMKEILADVPVPVEVVASNYAKSYKILGGDYIVEASRDYARRHPQKRKPRAVADVIEEMIALKTKEKKGSRYLEDLRTRLARFKKTFGGNIGSITGPEVQAWLNKMNAAPRTVKNFRSNISQLFKFAEAIGYITPGENPVLQTRLGKTSSDNEIEIYTLAEIVRLLNAAPDWFRPILALQAFAGLRSSEVCKLDWQDIRLARGHILVAAHKVKTKSRRLVPIVPNLAQWLAPFADHKGKLWKHTRAYFHEVQRNTAAATVIEADEENGVAAVAPVEWKHNALRHSFISYRLAEIQDAAKVALEAGNSPAMIFAHYREIVTPEEAKAWFAVVPSIPANVTPLSVDPKRLAQASA